MDVAQEAWEKRQKEEREVIDELMKELKTKEDGTPKIEDIAATFFGVRTPKPVVPCKAYKIEMWNSETPGPSMFFEFDTLNKALNFINDILHSTSTKIEFNFIMG